MISTRCFNRLARRETSAPWAKRKLGHFEKPSVVRRKRARVRRRNEITGREPWLGGGRRDQIKLWTPLVKRLRREGPFGMGQ